MQPYGLHFYKSGAPELAPKVSYSHTDVALILGCIGNLSWSTSPNSDVDHGVQQFASRILHLCVTGMRMGCGIKHVTTLSKKHIP
jgi:hypothetical protein